MSVPRPLLHAPGVATPALVRAQTDIAAEQATRLGLSSTAQQFLGRVVAGSGIEHRAAVLPLADVLHMSTAERMHAFHVHAPTLAERAARQALVNAGISAQDITDLIIVTTGRWLGACSVDGYARFRASYAGGIHGLLWRRHRTAGCGWPCLR